MRFHIMTLFPEMVEQGLDTSILGRARDKGLIDFEAVNIRDFSKDIKHRKVDDYTYGGGAGMLMQAQPIYDCYKSIKDRISDGSFDGDRKLRVVYVTPQGAVFNQKMASDMAGEDDLVFLCGHYEGVDERVLQEIVTDYVSIGDYVLTGGELPAMVMIDAISRLVPGVLNNDESAMTESFSGNLLEYPQYSRPEEWMGMKVPAILLSGDHRKVDEWRHKQCVLRTRERRPDLYMEYMKTERFQVGVIASTHGLQGEVNVFPTTEDPARFKKLKKVRLHTARGEEIDLDIASARFFKKFVIVKFKQFNNINDVEKFKGCELTIDRKDAIKLQPGEYYCADLIGMTIVDEEEKELGTLSEILQTGANDVYEMTLKDSEEKVYIPAIKECIKQIDVENRRIVIHVMDGLLN
ncbi:MAG: tRNA (guanosine(37)-N1)-methyltransferase TrmD [Butyrivibrio sp.]|nr:tRNA (guanosine(37)-N1)-methyltransferase TrmD [Butyrivibrio sp.]